MKERSMSFSPARVSGVFAAIVLAVSIPAGPARADAVPGLADEEIVRRAYDPSFSVPPGFYRDPALSGSWTLVTLGDPQKDAVARTRREALALVTREIASANVPQLRERPDDEEETEKYFSFRVGTYWWRVHKEAWFDWRESTQWPPPSLTSGRRETVGVFKRRPVDEASAAAFAEYHEVLTERILGGTKVVRTGRASPSAGWSIRHTEARVSSPNLSPLPYDTVDVWVSAYEIDRETGVVVKSRVHVASLRGRERRHPAPGTPVPP
jgi:hypothetical protein